MELALVAVGILVALVSFPLFDRSFAVLAPLVDLWNQLSLALFEAIFVASGELALPERAEPLRVL